MTPSSVRIDAGLWALCAAAAVFAAVLAAPGVIAGSDLYWHIAAGRWMIENQQVLRIDPFSFTSAGASAGHAWEIQDWLSELLFAAAYVGAGWSGVLALAATATAGAASLLAFHLAHGRRGSIAAIWLGLAIVTGAGAVEALPFLLALPCLVAWTSGLLRAGEEGPSLKLLPLILVWANLSSSFVIGLVLVVVLAGEAVVFAKGHRLAILRAWAVFAGLALIFSLMTPTGVFGLAHALRTLKPAGPVETVLPLLLAVPAAAVLAPQRRMILRLIFLAGLFALALTGAAGRIAFAVTAPLLAIGPGQAEAVRPRGRALLALAMLMTVAAGLRIALPLVRSDDAATPQSALAAVSVPLKHQPVLNDDAFGGYLIFCNVKPFIDSRPLYNIRFRRQYARIGEPGLLAKTLMRYQIRWTIFAPSHPAVKTLDGLTGWHRLYTDRWAVVHVKDDVR